jgi:hypothetical protein
MKENLIKVLTLFAGFTILFAVGLLLADIGVSLATGLVYIVTRPELLLAITLFVGAWLFARNIGPSFDRLFEK